MSKQYAFSFDAKYCSGCKACQAACKDKNNLPTGILWRRVIEVSGGTWKESGNAWNNTVFAYNLSISCNHCAYPKCAGVCPTDAYVLREDGIVFLDTTKCIGCGYCAWACPYGAPQYDASAGHMSKCDFCVDNLEQGLPPACVASCPLRVLDFGDLESVKRGLTLWDTPPELHPFPLSVYSHTQPRLAINPHPAMSIPAAKSVANLEEIQPRTHSQWEELPLILFTLLTQMAVGGFWTMTWMFTALWLVVGHNAIWLRLLPSMLIGMSLGAGMLSSFAHLGTKKNAWRVLGHLRKSYLSREILFTGLFGFGWLAATLENIILHRNGFEWTAITSILGIGLVYSMSQVYRFPAAPGWNSWRTNVGFFASAMLLGLSFMMPILAYESIVTGLQVHSRQWMMIDSSIFVLLLIQLALAGKHRSQNPLRSMRVSLIVIGMIACTISLVTLNLNILWMSVLLFLFILVEEGIGRWIFYASRLDD